jgi:outer membrane autotransporter protein
VNSTGTDSHRAFGVGGAAWFGYDFWVANEWAMGPQLRLMGMRTSDTKSGEDVSAFARSFTLGVSAVFN